MSVDNNPEHFVTFYRTDDDKTRFTKDMFDIKAPSYNISFIGFDEKFYVKETKVCTVDDKGGISDRNMVSRKVLDFVNSFESEATFGPKSIEVLKDDNITFINLTNHDVENYLDGFSRYFHALNIEGAEDSILIEAISSIENNGQINLIQSNSKDGMKEIIGYEVTGEPGELRSTKTEETPIIEEGKHDGDEESLEEEGEKTSDSPDEPDGKRPLEVVQLPPKAKRARFNPAVNNSTPVAPAAGAVAQAAYDPSKKVNLNISSGKDIMQMIEIMQKSSAYSGFNAPAIQKSFYEHIVNNKNKRALGLVAGLIVYVQAGNNVNKLSSNRFNKKQAEELKNKIAELNILRHAEFDYDVTLSRLALVFPAELLIVRALLVEGIQDHTESELPVKYQDIAFQGVTKINSMNGFPKFAKEFSAQIFTRKKGEFEYGVDETDEKLWAKFEKDYKRWDKVSKNGYKSAHYAPMRDRFDEAFNLLSTNPSKEDGFNFIADSLDKYFPKGLPKI